MTRTHKRFAFATPQCQNSDMSFLDNQSQAWDSAHWEFTLVFEDLSDEDLWRRAHPQLLSVGEIAAHVLYWEVERANMLNPEADVETSLKREEARYYLTSVDRPLQLEMSVAELEQEFSRVQKRVKAALQQTNLEGDDPAPPNGPGPKLSDLADYMVFHVAYHTGQAFSVRHLMGHKTNDN